MESRNMKQIHRNFANHIPQLQGSYYKDWNPPNFLWNSFNVKEPLTVHASCMYQSRFRLLIWVAIVILNKKIILFWIKLFWHVNVYLDQCVSWLLTNIRRLVDLAAFPFPLLNPDKYQEARVFMFECKTLSVSLELLLNKIASGTSGDWSPWATTYYTYKIYTPSVFKYLMPLTFLNMFDHSSY